MVKKKEEEDEEKHKKKGMDWALGALRYISQSIVEVVSVFLKDYF